MNELLDFDGGGYNFRADERKIFMNSRPSDLINQSTEAMMAATMNMYQTVNGNPEIEIEYMKSGQGMINEIKAPAVIVLGDTIPKPMINQPV